MRRFSEPEEALIWDRCFLQHIFYPPSPGKSGGCGMSLFALDELPWFIDPEDESTVYAVDEDGKWWDVRAVIQAMETTSAREKAKECNCE